LAIVPWRIWAWQICASDFIQTIRLSKHVGETWLNCHYVIVMVSFWPTNFTALRPESSQAMKKAAKEK